MASERREHPDVGSVVTYCGLDETGTEAVISLSEKSCTAENNWLMRSISMLAPRAMCGSYVPNKK